MKNRLADPSEICALDFKGEFGRSEIGSVSVTIVINRSIFDISPQRTTLHQAAEKYRQHHHEQMDVSKMPVDGR
jgi:hypothetical protein